MKKIDAYETSTGAVYKDYADAIFFEYYSKLAIDWAITSGCTFKKYKVTKEEWRRIGPAAGPIRNQRMFDEGKPDLVIAFPGGNGTADMVRRSKKAGIEVIEVKL